jgi:VanZ family protein
MPSTPEPRAEWRRRRQTWRLLWAAMIVVYVGTLYVGTHLPVAALPPLPQGSDKGLHFGAYFGLGWLVGMRPLKSWHDRLWASLGIWAWGALDEVTQTLVGRHADFYDWCSDAGGAAVGLVLSSLLWQGTTAWWGGVVGPATVSREPAPR